MVSKIYSILVHSMLLNSTTFLSHRPLLQCQQSMYPGSERVQSVMYFTHLNLTFNIRLFSIAEWTSSRADESFRLPAPNDPSDDSGDDESDYSDHFTEIQARGAFDDWLCNIDKHDKKMIVVMLNNNYLTQFGLTEGAADNEIATLLGVNEKTVRLRRNDLSAK